MSRLLPLRYCSDRFARSSHGYTCYPFIYPSVYNEVLYVCSVVNSVQHANYHCTSVQLLYKCSVSIPSEQCSDYEHLFSATTTPPLPPNLLTCQYLGSHKNIRITFYTLKRLKALWTGFGYTIFADTFLMI